MQCYTIFEIIAMSMIAIGSIATPVLLYVAIKNRRQGRYEFTKRRCTELRERIDITKKILQENKQDIVDGNEELEIELYEHMPACKLLIEDLTSGLHNKSYDINAVKLEIYTYIVFNFILKDVLEQTPNEAIDEPSVKNILNETVAEIQKLIATLRQQKHSN